MKIEVLAARNREHRCRLARGSWPICRVMRLMRLGWRHCMNMRNWLPGAARLAERLTGIVGARASCRRWRGKLFRLDEPVGPAGWTDAWRSSPIRSTPISSRSNLWDAVEVLVRLGYRVEPLTRQRPRSDPRAAAARSWRRGSSTRRGPRRERLLERRNRSSTQACRSSAWSRRAC